MLLFLQYHRVKDITQTSMATLNLSPQDSRILAYFRQAYYICFFNKLWVTSWRGVCLMRDKFGEGISWNLIHRTRLSLIFLGIICVQYKESHTMSNSLAMRKYNPCLNRIYLMNLMQMGTKIYQIITREQRNSYFHRISRIAEPKNNIGKLPILLKQRIILSNFSSCWNL